MSDTSEADTRLWLQLTRKSGIEIRTRREIIYVCIRSFGQLRTVDIMFSVFLLSHNLSLALYSHQAGQFNDLELDAESIRFYHLQY